MGFKLVTVSEMAEAKNVTLQVASYNNFWQDKFKALLCAKAEEIADQVDVVLLAQGSMAYAEDAIHEKIGKPVLSSPRFGAQALAAALKAKGL